ncbi:PREDICTED: HLA class II histocompatibility antigen gamma chain isoform X2 [Nanorana parkeri]|uniref:HLA class II histocompatibility antigen gamma chain isoform X2 n=1 Tax=Nanorana parkeri TaxID=125878 RepID=UPI000853F5E5|nr:PREDICTED: HLA class II histocompatibility antigen gamma chain isoform X2 [Nanorana parkeri]
MADETQNLVQNGIPEESVVETGERQSRTVTCTKKTVMPILSIFVALLIAGQAVSVYFISQQQSTISHLQETTTALKLKDMMKNLPGSPQSQNRPKLRMASFNIPLAFKDTDGSSPNLEEIAEGSNKIEDAVKYMLLRTNPLRTYPSLNGTVLDNLRKLKKNLSDQEWMVFDAWMQQWYLFYLVQNTDTPKTAPAPTGASVLSECMAKASVHALPGAYLPQCDENGGFKATQCWRSTGYCWCVYKNGTEIPDTRSRAKIDCESKNTHVLLI